MGNIHSPAEMSTYSVLLKTMILLLSQAWCSAGSVGVGGLESSAGKAASTFRGWMAPKTGMVPRVPGSFWVSLRRWARFLSRPMQLSQHSRTLVMSWSHTSLASSVKISESCRCLSRPMLFFADHGRQIVSIPILFFFVFYILLLSVNPFSSPFPTSSFPY